MSHHNSRATSDTGLYIKAQTLTDGGSYERWVVEGLFCSHYSERRLDSFVCLCVLVSDLTG